MAVVKTMNATITTGEYQNQQGETKKSYMTIGTLFIYDDGGMSLKLDAAPLGNGNINFYEKKPKENNQGQQQGGYNQPPQHNQMPPVEYQNQNGQPMTQQHYNQNMQNNGGQGQR